MYLTCVKRKHNDGKTYETWLLRKSIRHGNTVKSVTIARLSNSSPEEIAAIKFALKHKGNLSDISEGSLRHLKGKSVGSAWVIAKLIASTGIENALGKDFHAQLAMWLIIARILGQGSRLSAARLSQTYDIASVLKLTRGFNEED